MRVKSIRDLAPVHRSALRYVGGETDIAEPTGKTIRILVKGGLLTCREGKGSPASRSTLTSKGERLRKEVLASGDGPEDLKAHLRF